MAKRIWIEDFKPLMGLDTFRFTVVHSTADGPWYEQGYRLINGRVKAPSYKVGNVEYCTICQPPANSMKAIKNEALRELIKWRKEQ